VAAEGKRRHVFNCRFTLFKLELNTSMINFSQKRGMEEEREGGNGEEE